MTDNQILTAHISSLERGTIFFAEDLEHLGITPSFLRILLPEMAREGTLIVRLARGIYCFPKLSHDYPPQRLLPSPDEIAHAVAARWKVNIVPTSAHAAYLAGLYPFSANPYAYASDGSDQVVHLQNGRDIVFVKRRSHKVYYFRSERLRNLSEGLRYLGPKQVGPEQKAVIGETLTMVSLEDFRHDILLMPAWIRELLIPMFS